MEPTALGKIRVKYPKGVRFRCIRCARCCIERNVLLLPEDVGRLARVTGLSPEEFAVPVRGLRPYTHKLKKTREGCVFLRGRECSVYPYRPLACRFYPFALLRTGTDYVFIVIETCPGIGKGPELEWEFFGDLLLWYLAWEAERASKNPGEKLRGNILT